MDRFVLALVAGLLGGAVGGLAVGLVRPGTPSTAESPAPAAGTEWKEIAERLGRIERALPPAGVAPAGLAGRPTEGPAASDAATEALLARVEERVAGAVERKWTELQERGDGKEQAVRTPPKKRATLAEAAAEVGLSRSEEAELRRIYDDTKERLVKILADPEGDLETVRKDLEMAKDEKRRAAVVMKYLPKVLPKIGDLMSVGMERDARIQETLGAERAARLDRFEIEEADPLGFGGDIRMEARSR